MRRATEQDIPRLKEKLLRKSEQLGIPYRNGLNDSRWEHVFAFEYKDELIGAIVLRRTYDCLAIGDDPRLLAAAVEHQEEMDRQLAEAGLYEVHAFVPREILTRPNMWRIMAKTKFDLVRLDVAFDRDIGEGNPSATR